MGVFNSKSYITARATMKTKIADAEKTGRVIVVGSSNTDLVSRCASLPRAGETVLGGDLRTFAGGKGANQAVAAARAGARVVFVGAFGDDAFGQARRADLERDGIDCSGCAVKKGAPSGVALIGVGRGENGAASENQIIVAAGANARLTAADVRRGMPKDLSPRDVVLCSLEVPLAAVREALALARRKGAATVLNPAPCPPKGLPLSLLNLCDAITPNETEFQTLANATSDSLQPSLLKFFKRSRCGALILTQGAKGASCFFPRNTAKSESSSLDVFQVTPPKVNAVDTVGAGDCLNGALAAHLASHDADFESALRFAVTAATVKVTRHGAQAGMPKRADILKMMRRMK
jgi:ribokinase